MVLKSPSYGMKVVEGEDATAVSTWAVEGADDKCVMYTAHIRNDINRYPTELFIFNACQRFYGNI